MYCRVYSATTTQNLNIALVPKQGVIKPPEHASQKVLGDPRVFSANMRHTVCQFSPLQVEQLSVLRTADAMLEMNTHTIGLCPQMEQEQEQGGIYSGQMSLRHLFTVSLLFK